MKSCLFDISHKLPLIKTRPKQNIFIMKRSLTFHGPQKKARAYVFQRQHTEETLTNSRAQKRNPNKALRTCFLRNKDPHFEGVSIPILKKHFKSLDILLETLTVVLRRHVALKTAIRRIYRIDGSSILKLDDILDGDIIVCCCQYEDFMDVGYKVNRKYTQLLGNMIHQRGKYYTAPRRKKERSLVDFDISDLPQSISLYIDVPNFLFRNKSTIIFEGIGKADRSKLYIVKMVDKDCISEYSSELHNEIEILRSLQSHPNIIELIYSVEQSKHIFVVVERMNCDLFELMTGRAFFPEGLVKFIMKNVANGMHYIHSKRIVHRDIKLENLLVGLQHSPDKKSIVVQTVKIADFGLAINFHGRELFQWCGTPHYMAPEILNYSGYGFRVDCWSFGITLYNMLFRRFPFAHEYNDKADIWRSITCSKKFVMSVETAKMISPDAQNLLTSLLCKSQSKRLSALEIQRHPFWNSRHY